jgi:hypothetical protein
VFQQPQAGNWEAVFSEVRTALRARSSDGNPAPGQ